MGLKGYRLWVMGQLDSNVWCAGVPWRRVGRHPGVDARGGALHVGIKLTRSP
jgi:hypothetical protein